jgi:predicted negative regulator of RcsB-dependent stress response
MRKLKEQNPMVVASVIIGACALFCGGWVIYQRHAVEQATQTFFGSPAQIPSVAGALKSKSMPPPQ